jgi:arylsulfatase A-like enzyme
MLRLIASFRKYLTAAFLFSGAAALANQGPPNVLFIVADDLRPELGSYGAPVFTPNIDRLAASGLQFNRAYCAQAVCGPSRIALMSGLYPEYTKKRRYHVNGWRSEFPDVVTLNQLFKQNGYSTVGLGKLYHRWNGPDADEKNWNRLIFHQGLKYADPESYARGKEQAAEWGKPFSRPPTTEAATAENADVIYFDGWMADEGSRQLEKLALGDQPFFLAVGFSKPHLPFNAPARFWELYEPETIRMPENQSVPPGYPDYARLAIPGELGHYSDIPPSVDPDDFSDELNERLIHGYRASVSYLDYNVGKLIEALEASGAAQNTIVVLWGDHGFKLGEHNSWAKHTNFEIDSRVPLIIVDPRMPTARGQTDALTELMDLYPTLAELCGLNLPGHLQSRSFRSVLQNPDHSYREYAYSTYYFHSEGIVGHSIRNKRYRYTEWWDETTDALIDRVATDLIADPAETTNALLENPDLIQRFAADLREAVRNARTLGSHRAEENLGGPSAP